MEGMGVSPSAGWQVLQSYSAHSALENTEGRRLARDGSSVLSEGSSTEPNRRKLRQLDFG